MQKGYWKPTWTGKHCRRCSRLIRSPLSSLSAFSMEVGLKVAECLFEDEVQRHCGPRHDRRLDDRLVVIHIDAQAYAGEMMMAAMGITASGEKKLLGLRQGATENAAVCTSLLEDLRERG